jgi:hypothetical protein
VLPAKRRQATCSARQIHDGIRNTLARSKRDDTDFGFQSRRVKIEQNIACYVLLRELVANRLVETFGT